LLMIGFCGGCKSLAMKYKSARVGSSDQARLFPVELAVTWREAAIAA
jgi:hypothetical protein